MDNKLSRTKTLSMLAIVAAATMVFSVLFMFGCTDTIDGDMNVNQKPIVYFVNIPPDGQQFSRNPEVYWVGLDNDGQIDYFRYYVISEDDLGGADPLIVVADVDDTLWTYLDVDPLVSDPQTTNTISLKADLNDPVNTYVPQYVFLQACDDNGLMSDIVYRVFNRNDNPPETMIYSIYADTPYVNSVLEGGIITGVRLRWEGTDRKDYDEQGLEAPPFEFEWKLFGPYTDEEAMLIDSSYIKIVFVTEDARIFGLGDTLIRCDTFVVDTSIGGVDTTIFIDSCDTVVFEDTTANTPFFSQERLLDIDSTDFFSSKLVTTSSNGIDPWVMSTSDTIYNVYRNEAPDTTVQLNFVFWIRSRDDALVADLTPDFKIFGVINPQFERDVAIIDFTGIINPPYFTVYKAIDTAKAFWYNSLKTWKPDVVFDTTFFDESYPPTVALKTGVDYIMAGRYPDGIPLSLLLKHKMLILYSEDIRKSGFVEGPSKMGFPEILMAIDAGINVWATWRAPVDGEIGFTSFYPQVPLDYTRYFGVEDMVFSNWIVYAMGLGVVRQRIEDFIGAYSIDTDQWPNFEIDTSYLHNRLLWSGPASKTGWVDSIGSLPEVNWSSRSYGTEVMYLYKSRFGGASHPVGFIYTFEGSPVAHRLETSIYRTVHFNFTPLVIRSDQAQLIVNNVMEWIYEPWLDEPVSAERYPNAAVKISIPEARQHFLERGVRDRDDDPDR